MTRTAKTVRRIVRNTGWMVGGKIVGAALSLVYLAIVTRSLGVEGFGNFALALGAAQAVELLIAFQSWQIVVRFGMPHLQAGRTREVARLLRFTTILDAGAALAAAAVVLVVLMLLGSRFGWTAPFVQQAILCGLVFVLSTHWTPIGVLLMCNRFAEAALADTVTPVVRFVGTFGIWLWAPSVIGFLAVWAAAELLTAMVYWYIALRIPGLRWRVEGPLRWREVAEENPGIWKFSVTTNVKSSLEAGSRQMSVVLVGLLLSPAAVGVFRLAQQLVQSLVTFSQLAARALFPELMRSSTGASWTTDFNRLLMHTARIAGIGGLAIVLVLLLLGRPLLGLIASPQFQAAYPVLLLLGTSAAIEFAAVGFEPALVALGRPGLALAMRFCSTMALLTLIVVMTPALGTVGAGIAALAASVLLIASLLLALRHLRRKRFSASSVNGHDPEHP